MRGLALLVMLLLLPTAAAHASAIRTDPPQMTGLAEAPEYISIEYSEPLDFERSSIGIYDDQLLRRDAGDAFVDPENPRVVKVYTGNLIKGIYTVGYEMRSAADGHMEKGSMPLTIGVPCTTCLAEPEAVSFDARATPWGETWTVAVGYVAIVLAAGAVVVALLGQGQAPLATQRLLIVALAAASVATFARAEQIWQYIDGAARWGMIVRAGAIIVAALGLWRIQQSGRGMPVVAVGVLVALLAWPLGGHGARSWQDWTIQASHLLLVAPWAGGLLVLAAVWRHIHDGHRVLVRFSRLALLCVAGLVVSGTLLAATRLQAWSDVWATAYGQVMLLKLLLVTAGLVAGAMNHRRIWHGLGRLRIWSTKRHAQSRRWVRFEALAVVAALLVTGVLGMQSIPADRAPPAEAYTESSWWGDYFVHLEVWPAVDGVLRVGDHRHEVRILDREGNPVTGVEVIFEFRPQLLEIGIMTQPATETGNGWYQVAGNYLNGLGKWEERIRWRMPSGTEHWAVFDLDLGAVGHFHGGSKLTDPHFDTGYMAEGASYSRVFAERDTGRFVYHCHPHQWMVASITVDANATQGDVVVEIFGNAGEPAGSMYFLPADITIAPGSTVEWINRGDIPHSATNVEWSGA